MLRSIPIEVPLRTVRVLGNLVWRFLCRVWLVFGLTILLLRAIGVGGKWVAKLFRLTIFALLLLPAWTKAGYYYFSQRVIRDIRYGPRPRNYCDIYTISNTDSKEPSSVVVLVMGGAWIIGLKTWSCLLAKYIAENGVIVVAVDYRNFPQGNITDMIQDVEQSLAWTYKNIHLYGGDPEKISLLGQSAGAHMSSLVMLSYIRAILNKKHDSEAQLPSYRVRDFISLSGPYDLPAQAPLFAEHGFHSFLFNLVMNGDLLKYSPIQWIERNILNNKHKIEDDKKYGRPLEEPEEGELSLEEHEQVEREIEVEREWLSNYFVADEDEQYEKRGGKSSEQTKASSGANLSLPKWTIIHGTNDACVNCSYAQKFAKLLDEAGIPNQLIINQGKAHTDYIIEDLVEGNEQSVLSPILNVVFEGSSGVTDTRHWLHEPIVISKILVFLARLVNPF